MLILKSLIGIGVETLFVSPNCAPWGNHTRNLPKESLDAKRLLEEPALEFVTMCCFLQTLLGRKYIVENSAFSDIFTQSPLRHLREIEYFLSSLDQCACGGRLEGEFIRKRSHFQGSHPLKHLDVQCPGGHSHLNLRGHQRVA